MLVGFSPTLQGREAEKKPTLYARYGQLTLNGIAHEWLKEHGSRYQILYNEETRQLAFVANETKGRSLGAQVSISTSEARKITIKLFPIYENKDIRNAWGYHEKKFVIEGEGIEEEKALIFNIDEAKER